ncbi:MAG: hypothetical protein ACK5VZ_03400 [Alphaproteobacteria bacterium]
MLKIDTNSKKPQLGIVRIIKLTLKVAVAMFALLFAVALITVLFGKDKEIVAAAEQRKENLAQEAEVAAGDHKAIGISESAKTPTLPTQQQEFMRIINEARAAYSSAPNEMLKGKVRVDRKQKLCKLLTRGRVDNWIGTIAELESSSEGKGVLAVEIEGEDILIKTWNNDFSDIGDRSMINPNSPLFASVSAMSEGDRIIFSVVFYQSREDCLNEGSLTQQGSVLEPEFIFKFSDVKPLQ